jgi:glycosyltransferase 2 family protein
MSDGQEDLSRSTPDSGTHRWLAGGFVLGVLLLVAIVLIADGRELLNVIGQIDLVTLWLPLACTAGSYAAMARSYQRIADLAGIRIGFFESLKISLVSTAANYLLSTGGLSGIAMRSYYFSQRHRATWGAAVSISLAQTVVTNLVLFTFLFWGLLVLILHDDVRRGSALAAGTFFLVSFALFLLIIAVVASRRARQRVFGALLRLADRLARPFGARGHVIREKLEEFEIELHAGVDFLIASGHRMWVPVVYIWLDWFLMMATLYAAFVCVQQPVAMGVVVVGFAVGVFLSIVNLIPGGLGIMEGSMAALFAGLGVPLGTAVVATLLYRAFYYLLPLLISVLFLRETLFLSSHSAPNARLAPQSSR